MGLAGEGRSRGRAAATAAGVAAATFAGTLLGTGLELGTDPQIVWPLSAVGLLLVLVLGLRQLAPAVLGSTLALLTTDLPVGAVLALAGGIALGIAAPALLLRRRYGGTPSIEHLADLGRLALAAALDAAVVAAAGTAALAGADRLGAGRADDVAVQWFAGTMAVTLAIVPGVLVLRRGGLRLPSRGRTELAVIAALLAAGIGVGLLGSDHASLVLPGVAFAGLRLRCTGAAWGMLLVAAGAAIAGLAGIGLADGDPGTGQVIERFAVLGAAALSAFALGLLEEERERALNDAESGRRLLRQVIDSSPAQFFAKDLEGRYTVLSPRVAAYTERHRAMLEAGAPVHPDLDAQAEREEAEMLARDAPITSTVRSPFDGRWHEVTRFPLRDGQGRTYGIGAFTLDVTDTREAVASLAAREALLARTEAMAHIGGWAWDVATDRGALSPETFAIYGRDPTVPAVGMAEWLSVIHPDDRARVSAVGDAAIARREPWTVRTRILRSDGSERIVRVHSEPVFDADGALVELRGFTHDITELADAEAEAVRAERRYRELVERLPAVLYVAGAGEREGWRFVSGQIERLTGWSAEEWLADPELWRRSLHPDDRDRVLEADRQATESGGLTIEYRLQTRDGRTVWVQDDALVRVDEHGEPFLEGLITDVTERKAFETQLRHLADHDPLTGLYNRRRFGAELEREARLAARGGRDAVLLVLDLDNFKYVNDSLGHQAGDALIRGVSELIRRRLRATDTLCRLGGDEFAALLRDTTLPDALVVAEQLLVEIRERAHTAGGEPVRVTASAGAAPLAGAVGPDRSADDHLAAADLAMYRAKADGRDRVAIFSTELQQEIDVGRAWADRVRAALEEDRLALFCQPIVDLATGAISQWEVLVRMIGDDGEVITPNRFLPIAERFGLMPAVDRWVITRAIDLMGTHHRAGRPLRLEVNVSGASMGDPELTRAIETALNVAGVPPRDLILEVTETAAIANLEAARAFAEGLSRLGCRFALDDFGSGFASFYYLKHLPLQYVKIDGDFIRGLCSSRVDQEIVRAMIGIARAFGHRTVAEFVEDEPTVALLRELGVDYAQGYHLGMPRPVAEITAATPAQPRAVP